MQANDSKNNKTIIIVDSEATQLFSTGMLLQRLAYNIFPTGTAEGAMQVIQVALPTVVVTELWLPGMTGFDLLTSMKKDMRTQAVPVIILTKEDDFQREAACWKAGCAAYLRKPVDPDLLYRAIQQPTEATPRSTIRIKTDLKVSVGGMSAGDTGECVTVLSENGMYIRTLRPWKVGTHLPFTVFVEDRALNVEGLVLYSYAFGEGPLKDPGMGVKFLSISSEDRETLRQYIRRHLNG